MLEKTSFKVNAYKTRKEILAISEFVKRFQLP